MKAVRIVGSYISSYVCKVLVCLYMKGIPYEIDPIVLPLSSETYGTGEPRRGFMQI